MPIDLDPMPLPAEKARSSRELLFRETPLQALERIALAGLWALKPDQIGKLRPYVGLLIADTLRKQHGLPDPRSTDDPSGFVGIVHDLSVPTLLAAYRSGLYTTAEIGPLCWTSPLQRCVLSFDELHFSKRLRRLMRQGRYTVTFDRAFERVIKACAGRREGRWHVTWISPRIMRAYAALFDAGHVHSFEVWNDAGELVGGGYGVALGRIFFTESQFSHEDNTSKLGFTVLNWHLSKWGYLLNDGKNPTRTILDMGFRSVPRDAFLRLLAAGTASGGKSGRWETEAGVVEVANWQPQITQAAG